MSISLSVDSLTVIHAVHLSFDHPQCAWIPYQHGKWEKSHIQLKAQPWQSDSVRYRVCCWLMKGLAIKDVKLVVLGLVKTLRRIITWVG